MKNELGYNVFGYRVYHTKLATQGVALKNIPESTADYRIKSFFLDSSLSYLHIFYGLTSIGQRMVIFDSDFDGDLKNETIYLFGKDVSYKSDSVNHIIDSVAPVEIKYPGTPSVFLKPSVFNCCRKYVTREDSTWHLDLLTSYFRRGYFELNGRSYTLSLSGSPRPAFKGFLEFFLFDDRVTAKADYKKAIPNHLSDKVYADRSEFIIDSVNRYGDTVWIVYNGEVDSVFGSRIGQYAKSIKTTTLENKPFDIASLKGNFVLLDFWGTWCGPCIELIPNLVELHDKHKKKVWFVSIANDEKKNLGKLKNMVRQKRMSWIQLFDDENEQNSITNQYDVSCFPTSILVDPKGKIVFRGCGKNDFDDLVSAIDYYTNLE